MSAENGTILVIDDEVQIRRLLKAALESHDYSIIEAETASQGISLAATNNPGMIILDLGLPDMDGQKVIKELRNWYEKPILILSVRNDDFSVVNALDSGANDYVRKPFSMGELLARLRALSRIGKSCQSEPVLAFGRLEIDIAHRKVLVENTEVKLTHTEYDLLKLLAQNAGKVLTHKQVLSEIWGPKASENTQYLRVYIGHLRQKIEKDPDKPELIITEPAVGYRFNA
ncbi:MAG: response regulator [Oligoflexales bacterium]|nr:response regulator [Oligoflexales bacterium]